MKYPLYNLVSGTKLLKCYSQSSIRVSSQCLKLGSSSSCNLVKNINFNIKQLLLCQPAQRAYLKFLDPSVKHWDDTICYLQTQCSYSCMSNTDCLLCKLSNVHTLKCLGSKFSLKVQ